MVVLECTAISLKKTRAKAFATLLFDFNIVQSLCFRPILISQKAQKSNVNEVNTEMCHVKLCFLRLTDGLGFKILRGANFNKKNALLNDYRL